MILVSTLADFEERVVWVFKFSGSCSDDSDYGGLSLCREGTEEMARELYLWGTHCIQALPAEDMKGFAFERLEMLLFSIKEEAGMVLLNQVSE